MALFYAHMKKVGGLVKKVFPDSRLISLRRLPKGCVNKTYEVEIKNPKKLLIFRIFPTHSWKAVKEAYVYNLISKKTPVPVPNIYLADSSKRIYPDSFTLLSKIPGKELKKTSALIEKAGEYLAHIHKIKFPKFGWIVGRSIQPAFTKWIDFCDYDLNHKLVNARKYHQIGKRLIKDVMSYYSQHRHLLNIDVKPCLLHKDYHFSHILVDKNKISGVIDVEWAISGHNELDLTKSLDWMFDSNKKLAHKFIKGYSRINHISEDFEKRKKLYELMISVSSVVFSCEMRNNKWLAFNLNKLKRTIR